MDEKDRLLIQELRERLPLDLESHLKRLIIYGSRARGDACEDSDLDLIALVDEKTPDIENRLEDIAYQLMWDHDFKPMISLRIFSKSHFNAAIDKGFSFYKAIEGEGVSV